MTETITTAEARSALPPGVIVRSAAGTIACRHDGGMGVCFGVERPFAWDQLALPLTVLWRPDQGWDAVETATVKPRVEDVRRVLEDYWDARARRRDPIVWSDMARAVLALPNGQRTEAEVLRDAANRLGDEAASSDYMAAHLSDDGLAWIVRKLREYADELEG